MLVKWLRCVQVSSSSVWKSGSIYPKVFMNVGRVETTRATCFHSPTCSNKKMAEASICCAEGNLQPCIICGNYMQLTWRQNFSKIWSKNVAPYQKLFYPRQLIMYCSQSCKFPHGGMSYTHTYHIYSRTRLWVHEGDYLCRYTLVLSPRSITLWLKVRNWHHRIADALDEM